MPTVDERPSPAREARLAAILFGFLLAFHGWAMSVGWHAHNMPGNEFRQAQTALSALFIQRDADFSLAYPTPVLGAPWSIPMEFPLYQWTVVAVSNGTGLSLIQSGRAVSIACFYGALAALFPLLGALGLSRPRRLVVMGLVLTCPLYIFYTRGFLIETMVLMFSLWFLVAFGRMITAPTWGRFALAMVAGVPAGLVKVTTFMVFLIPAGLWTAWEMRRQFQAAGLGAAARRGFWALGVIALPILAAERWTRFADTVKHRNPNADFLESGSLLDFNFGTVANRFSGETLAAHWRNLSHNVAGPLLLAAGLLLALTVGRRWWRQIALCLGCYLATLALFPTLYAWHDYYAIANGVLLLAGLGLAVAASLDLRPRWLPWVLLLALHATQLWTYQQRYYGMQDSTSRGGSDMTRALELMTNPDEVLVVAGHDWNSSTAFYSQRRALMIRNGMDQDAAYLEAAFRTQAAEDVAVLVVRDAEPVAPRLLALAEQHFNIDPRPLFRWQDQTVYGRRELRGRMVQALRLAPTLTEVALDPVARDVVWSLAGREVRVGELLRRNQWMFDGFAPAPEKFFAQHGTYATTEAGRPALFAHPPMSLWFKVPAGRRVLRLPCALQSTAYEGPPHDRTDGVEFVVEKENADGTRERLGALFLNPAVVPADAGWRELVVPLDLAAETRIVVSTGPGPAGSFARDWAMIGLVRIE